MDETPLTTVEDVSARVGEPIEAPDDVALANAMIVAASANVRHYGKPWPSPASAPAIARTIATAAAARGWMNPSGFSDERSDSVTLKRAEMYAADTQLTPQEIKMLQEAAGGGNVQSMRIALDEDYFRPRSARRGRFPFVRRDPAEGVPLAFPDGTLDNETPMPFFVRGFDAFPTD